MKDEEINKEFKETLKLFAKDLMGAGADFLNEIHSCYNYGDLIRLMEENSDSIFEELGGKTPSCDACEGKDEVIEELGDAVTDLTNENEEIQQELSRGYVPKTLNDEYKLAAFKRNVDNLSIEEFEGLLDK